MAELFAADTAAQVRAALDLSLGSDALSDSIINMGIYLGAAQAELVQRDPDALAHTDAADILNAKNALVYLTAARLAAVLPDILSEQLGDYRYTRSAWNAAAQAARLRALADIAIAAIVEPDGMLLPPALFTLATGGRGR
jgi:hypothetical protein